MTGKELKAVDIMQAAIKTVGPETPLPKLEDAFVKDKVSGYPVIDEGRLVGVVSRSDVVAQICTERTVAENVSDFHFDERNFYEVPMQSMKQIADRIGERIESLTVADVMNDRPLTVGSDATIRQIADKFVHHRIHRLPVVDHGVLLGIVTTIDLARLIAEGKFVSGPATH